MFLLPFFLLICLGAGFFLFLLPGIFYTLTLIRTLEKCDRASRTLAPGLLWLLLVPFVNLVMNFLVANGVGQTLANEFRRRGIPAPEPKPAQTIGIAMSLCGVGLFLGLVPVLGWLMVVAYFVLWVVYWIKIADYSKCLDAAVALHPTHATNNAA